MHNVPKAEVGAPLVGYLLRLIKEANFVSIPAEHEHTSKVARRTIHTLRYPSISTGQQAFSTRLLRRSHLHQTNPGGLDLHAAPLQVSASGRARHLKRLSVHYSILC